MVNLLYILGYLGFLFLFVKAFFNRRLNLDIFEKSLLFSVALIPLGKLVYMPISGFSGLKFSFLFATLTALFWVLFRGVRKDQLILLVPLIIPLLSILYIENHDWILFYQLNESQKESSLVRLITITILLVYSAVVYSALVENKKLIGLFSEYFILGTIVATYIGVFIAFFVYQGVFTEIDLDPISAGVHIVNISGIPFYRFNPGANVNEFSMILAFAIFLIPFTDFTKNKKFILVLIFLLFEFATLTRASWLALMIALSISLFLIPNSKIIVRSMLSLFVFLLIFVVLVILSDEVRYLVESRLSLDIGASGHERLEKFEYVFNRVSESIFRLLFGFGWATNMYVHNIYLQLLYEIGIVGLTAFIISILFNLRHLFFIKKSLLKASLFSMVIFISIVSFMHHNLYHIQTWFILGFVAAVAWIYRDNVTNKVYS